MMIGKENLGWTGKDSKSCHYVKSLSRSLHFFLNEQLHIISFVCLPHLLLLPTSTLHVEEEARCELNDGINLFFLPVSGRMYFGFKASLGHIALLLILKLLSTLEAKSIWSIDNGQNCTES